MGEFTANGKAYGDYWEAQDVALRRTAATGTPVAIERTDGGELIVTITSDTVRLLRASYTLLALVTSVEPVAALPRIADDGSVGVSWWVSGDFLDLDIHLDGTWRLVAQTGRQHKVVGVGSVNDSLPDHAMMAIRSWLQGHGARAKNGVPDHLREMWDAVGCLS